MDVDVEKSYNTSNPLTQEKVVVLSNALKIRSSGIVIGEFRDQKQLIPIELRLKKEDRDEISDLRGILVSSKLMPPILVLIFLKLSLHLLHDHRVSFAGILMGWHV